jgi:hypothetical protein
MPSQFTRPTLVAAAAILERRMNNNPFDRYVLELGCDNPQTTEGTLPTKINGLIRYAIANPEAVTLEGQNLWDALIMRAANFERPEQWSGFRDHPEVEKFVRTLARDGFTLEQDGLRRTLPDAVDLPAADDEVHRRLTELGFTTPLGHLEQAIANHTNGSWAAANAQLRTFVEALLDEVAQRLDPAGAQAQATSHGRRTLLANLNPPFLLRGVNEWEDNGKGYVNALFNRLHPEGSHPGLSDEEDSTFRLHTVLIATRLLLRRFHQRQG